jgi:CreA protein
MKRILAGAAILMGMVGAAYADGASIGEVSTTFNLLSTNDKVIVERYDDTKVQNASCYVSYAKTGGWKGMVGLAEDPSRFSIACRATGPVKIIGNIDRSKDGELVVFRDSSALFKTMNVTRFYDAEKNELVYLVWSKKLVNGSPFNSVSAIPVQ